MESGRKMKNDICEGESLNISEINSIEYELLRSTTV